MEISSDQNIIKFDKFTVKFYPVKRVKKTHCNACFLLKTVPCHKLDIPCRAWERNDKKNGVFSIREQPKQIISI